MMLVRSSQNQTISKDEMQPLFVLSCLAEKIYPAFSVHVLSSVQSLSMIWLMKVHDRSPTTVFVGIQQNATTWEPALQIGGKNSIAICPPAGSIFGIEFVG
jgi:hypothetical protein